MILWLWACRFTPYNYVPAAQTVGLFACSFLPLLHYRGSVSPHVENCFCHVSTAKRLPLQSLTLSKNWHPCQFLNASFLRSKKHRCCVEPQTSLSVWERNIWDSAEHEFAWNQRYPWQNLHDRRVYVRTVIFCEICIILILIPSEQYTYTTSSIFLRCNTLCRIYLFCPCLVRCFGGFSK